jgi:hypothetical protein
MDRTALARIAGILAALIPLSSRAEPPASAGAPANAPLIAHATGSTPQFVFLAGPSRSDIAWTIGGDLLVQTIELPDPAVEVSAALAGALAKRKGGQVVDAGRADYTVTVETTEWTAGYYVPSRPTYTVKYAARLTITDASGAVVKTATCGVPPDDSASAGGNDVLMAHKGKLMKSLFAKAAKSCEGELIQKTKSV